MIKFTVTEWLGESGIKKEYEGETVNDVFTLMDVLETDIYGEQKIDFEALKNVVKRRVE